MVHGAHKSALRGEQENHNREGDMFNESLTHLLRCS